MSPDQEDARGAKTGKKKTGMKAAPPSGRSPRRKPAVEPKDPNETVSVRQSKPVKARPQAAPPTDPSTDAPLAEKKPSRQTASANPISPDDLLTEQPLPQEDSLVPLASAFAVGLVAGLIAGILIGRE